MRDYCRVRTADHLSNREIMVRTADPTEFDCASLPTLVMRCQAHVACTRRRANSRFGMQAKPQTPRQTQSAAAGKPWQPKDSARPQLWRRDIQAGAIASILPHRAA